MKSVLSALVALCVCSLFAVESIGAECHGPFCRVERSVRVERIREVKQAGASKIRKSVRWVARGR